MAVLLALLFGGATAVFQNPSGSWRLNWDLSEVRPYEETGYAAPPELLVPSEDIALSVTDTLVTFYEREGTTRRYLLSGEKERSVYRGFEVYARARWNGHTLWLEVSPQSDLVVAEQYTRTATQLLLSVTVFQSGRRAGPVIRYVYDSVFPH